MIVLNKYDLDILNKKNIILAEVLVSIYTIAFYYFYYSHEPLPRVCHLIHLYDY